MICDFHVHTRMSADSEADIDSVINHAIALGMEYLCITDHHDIDYPDEEGLCFLLNPEEYYQTLLHYKEKYANAIKLLIGVELGLQPHIKTEVTSFLSQLPLDFVIGSSHLINGIDPYYETIWKQYSTREVMSLYFQNIEKNIQVFDDFDVYGHLDYAIRYAKEQDRGYCYETYAEILDRILKTLIQKGKGIELNTKGLQIGLSSSNPSEEIIRRYRELGGEIITSGSDAHKPEWIGSEFETAKEILLRCGFTHYHIFIKRKPIPVKLTV